MPVFSRAHVPGDPFWSAAVIPAGACVVGGLMVPLAQFPAAFLACLVGKAAILAVPMALFGAIFGKGLTLLDDGESATSRWTAIGFGVGGGLAALAFEPTSATSLPALGLIGAFGGAGLAIGRLRTWASGAVLVPVTAIGFALAMITAGPAVTIGGT